MLKPVNMKKNQRLNLWPVAGFLILMLSVFLLPGHTSSNTPVSNSTDCLEAEVSHFTLSVDSVCPGEQVFVIVFGELNDTENWYWYDNDCGEDLPLFVGNLVTVYPDSTTTLFVRGEGPCLKDPTNCFPVTITVMDTLAPEISCVGDQIGFVDENCEYTLPDYTDLIIATDDCSVPTLTQYPEAGNVVSENTIISVIAKDEVGNKDTCQFQLILTDTFPPSALCKDITIDLDSAGRASISGRALDAGSSDACGDIKLQAAKTSFGCSDIGEQMVTLVVEDKLGNTNSCTSKVTVQDTEPPTLNCPAVIDIYLDELGQATITIDDIPVTVEDNCGIDQLQADELTLNCGMAGPHSITVKAVDFLGNVSTCSPLIELLDTVAPTPKAKDITVALDASGVATINKNQVDDGSYDNCQLDTVWLDQTTFNCDDLTINQVKLMARDVAGNTGTVSFEVTVIDEIAPLVTCPDDQTISVEATCEYTLQDFTNGASVSDNCQGAITMEQSPTAGTSLSGSRIITLTAIDASGNEGSCSFNITPVDDTAPTIECPNDQVVFIKNNCEATVGDFRSFPTFEDNCGFEALLISQSPQSGTAISQNTIITITVADEAGNENQCDFELLITDQTRPEISCIDNQVVYMDEQCQAILPDYTSLIEFSDECVQSLEIEQIPSAGQIITDESDIEIVVRDSFGNTTNCLFKVEPLDTIAPQVDCQNIVFIEIGSDGTAELTPADLSDLATDNCGVSSLSLDNNTFDCSKVGYNAVPVTVRDEAGNSASCTLTVGVKASAECSLPAIANNDEEMEARGIVTEIDIEAPCTCLGDGQFSEEIIIGPTKAGQQWIIANADLTDVNSQDQVAVGTPFLELPYSNDSSVYFFKGIHTDGNGYTLIAESLFFPNRTLQISNTCYYPDPQILELGDSYCLSEAAVELKGTVGQNIGGSGSFKINNQEATFFDPEALGPGNHLVQFTWDAGASAGLNEPDDVGCIESVTKLVQVRGTSPNFACNDLVRVTADDNCEAYITPQMVLSGNLKCFDDYIVRVYQEGGSGYLPNPLPAEYFNIVLNAIVEHKPTGRFCEGQLIMEDKTAPIINCPTQTYEFVCTDLDSLLDQEKAFEAIEYDLSTEIFDACHDRADISVSWADQFQASTDQCLDYGTITRRINAVDASGNVAEACEIKFLLKKPTLQTDLIEQPFSWDACGGVAIPTDENGHPDPIFTGAPYFINGFNDTVFVYNQTICDLFVAYEDRELEACGNFKEMIRTWSYADWCDPNNVIEVEQLIKIVDETAPVVEVPTDTLRKSTGPFDCNSAFSVPAPVISDCGDTDYSITISSIVPATDRFGVIIPGVFDTIALNSNITGNSRNGFFASNVPIGVHYISYKAIDDCGNTSAPVLRPVLVTDQIAPVAICGDDVNFSLGGNGIGQLIPEDVDKGSRDNCGEVNFKLRRVIEASCVENYVSEILGRQVEGAVNFEDLTIADNQYFLNGELVLTLEDGQFFSAFSDEVFFTCCDEGKIITVQMQVADPAGNTNFCWINVKVEDKLNPVVTPPAAVTIDCDELLFAANDPNDTLQLQQAFGNAVANDNCEATTFELEPIVNLNNCGVGTITRRFRAKDKAGNLSGTVQQLINVTIVNNYEVKFPRDAAAAECGTFNADTLEINEIGCDLLTINVEDRRFSATGDECYKIFRTYQIINWCEYDGIVDPITIGRDENGDNIPGEQIFLLRRSNNTYLDDDNDETNGFIKEISSVGFWRYVQTINVYDTEAPTVAVDSIHSFCTDGSNCEGIVDIPFSVNDQCNPSGLSVEVLLDLDADGAQLIRQSGPANVFAEGLNYLYTGTVPIGNHALVVRVTDGCGNVTTENIPFEVVDCKVASPICQGLSVELMPVEIDGVLTGRASVAASAFVASLDADSDCSGPLKLSIHKQNETRIDPNQDSLFLSCQDSIGEALPVFVYVWDNAYNPTAVQPDGSIGGPNYSVCETFVVVQDNQFDLCTIKTYANVQGAIATEEGDPVEGVMVQLSGQTKDSITTDIDGLYAFPELETNYDYSIKPELNHDYLNGVSTIDLVLISKHILGVKPFSSPYKLIAADANNSGSVTTFDMIQLRKLILSLDSELKSNSSWRFVDADYDFPNPQNPWLVNLPEVVSLNNLAETSISHNFIGIKVGDVNSNAQTSSLIHQDRNLPVKFIEIEDEPLQAGQTYTLRFNKDQLEELVGYQYTLAFNPDHLVLQDIHYAAARPVNFGLDWVADGLITTSWHDAGLTGTDDEMLYELTFQALVNTRWSSELELSSRLTKAEIYTADYQVLEPRLSFVGIDNKVLEPKFTLDQNFPNPFKTQTQISFTLPEAGRVNLTVFDAKGQIHYQISEHRAVGKHIIVLDKEDFPHGVLFYRLECGNYSDIKKMIVLE